MGILFVLAIAVPIGWCIASTVRALARARRAKLWIIGAALVAAGLALGWHWQNWEYQAGEKMRIGGFPIPGVVSRLENDQWTDFPLPGYVRWPGFFANLLAGVALLFLPFRFFLRQKA